MLARVLLGVCCVAFVRGQNVADTSADPDVVTAELCGMAHEGLGFNFVLGQCYPILKSRTTNDTFSMEVTGSQESPDFSIYDNTDCSGSPIDPTFNDTKCGECINLKLPKPYTAQGMEADCSPETPLNPPKPGNISVKMCGSAEPNLMMNLTMGACEKITETSYAEVLGTPEAPVLVFYNDAKCSVAAGPFVKLSCDCITFPDLHGTTFGIQSVCAKKPVITAEFCGESQEGLGFNFILGQCYPILNESNLTFSVQVSGSQEAPDFSIYNGTNCSGPSMDRYNDTCGHCTPLFLPKPYTAQGMQADCKPEAPMKPPAPGSLTLETCGTRVDEDHVPREVTMGACVKITNTSYAEVLGTLQAPVLVFYNDRMCSQATGPFVKLACECLTFPDFRGKTFGVMRTCSPPPKGSSGIGAGAVIGILFGCLCLVAGITFATMFVLKRRVVYRGIN